MPGIEPLETPRNPGADDGKCGNFYTCRNDGLTEDARYHGCGYLICRECGENDVDFGAHYVVDHFGDDDDDGLPF